MNKSMSTNLIREYDQILSGDVTIKKVSSDDYTHKITNEPPKVAPKGS